MAHELQIWWNQNWLAVSPAALEGLILHAVSNPRQGCDKHLPCCLCWCCPCSAVPMLVLEMNPARLSSVHHLCMC